MSTDTIRVSSMTGFGSAGFQVGSVLYRVTVKTVNHRNLNVRFHMPSDCQGAERAATDRVRARLSRGAVDVRVDLDDGSGSAISVTVDQEEAAALMGALSELSETLGMPPPTLDTLLRAADFVRVRREGVDEEELQKALLTGLEHALDAVVETRVVEGEALGTDIWERLDGLDDLLAAMEAKAPQVLEGFEARLRSRLAEAVEREGVAVDEGRLATELVLYADKCDITEEVVRARTHLESYRSVMSGGGALVGKRLDFLTQELLREFNTIGSKCRDAGLAGAVVDAKVELERIREQVQNIA